MKLWVESKGLNDDTVKHETKELGECPLRFFAEVRKSNGSDYGHYEPDIVRVMLAALDRHLRHNQSKLSITKDRELVKCRQVLEGKARALRDKGNRKRPNATRALTVQDEEHLWENRVLGEQNQSHSEPCPLLSSFAHSAQPYSDSSLPNSSQPLSWLSSDDKLRSWSWCFSRKAAIKRWNKITNTLS